ncbi:hypothetical protein FJ364_05910, partial [Candidatus Dependentiae bacterium]|nr:hypothetical protein [Candidatus Dependentiae bacterium]
MNHTCFFVSFASANGVILVSFWFRIVIFYVTIRNQNTEKLMKGLPYITALAMRGEFYFTTVDLMQQLSISEIAAKAMVSRLKNKNQIATPYNGFHLILPPEYQALGCLPAEQFISELMTYLRRPYYVGLLSAAQFYGAAHQKPQTFQVMLSDNRRSIHCGKIVVDFIARKNLEALPVRKFK